MYSVVKTNDKYLSAEDNQLPSVLASSVSGIETVFLVHKFSK